MKNRMLVVTLIGGVALGTVCSAGSSWAFDLENALLKKMEEIALDTADKTARTLADKGSKVLDQSLSAPSDQQSPPKNQGTPEAMPPKGDLPRANQTNAQGKTGQ